MRILVFYNQKGGTGKTTASLHLANYHALSGKKTFLLDMDPQGSLTRWLGFHKKADWETVRGLYQSPSIQTLETFTQTKTPNLFLLPSHPECKNLKKFLKISHPVELLKGLLGVLEQSGFDTVFIDSAPEQGFLIYSALVIATTIYVPVLADFMSIQTLPTVIQLIKKFQPGYNKNLKFGGVICTRYKKGNVSDQKILELLKGKFGSFLLDSKISESEELRITPSYYQTVFEQFPNSLSSQEYTLLYHEILENIESL
jgi:chromosome partitioning protein